MKQHMCHRMLNECIQRCMDLIIFISYDTLSVTFFSYPQLARSFSIEFHKAISRITRKNKEEKSSSGKEECNAILK